MGKTGRKPFLDRKTWAHISLYICKEDKDFINQFAKETYRDITSTIRLAINDLRNKYNEKGAKHGI
jgi:hypothetical protein